MWYPHTVLYIHLVWATWDRQPLITPSIEPKIYATINAKCNELHCVPIALGGIADHVHLLVRLKATVSVSDLAKYVKGSSSHFATHVLNAHTFKWQGSYGAFSLGERSVDQVANYIRMQKQHHSENNVIEAFEKCSEE